MLVGKPDGAMMRNVKGFAATPHSAGLPSPVSFAAETRPDDFLKFP
jgi:hypothetical protein